MAEDVERYIGKDTLSHRIKVCGTTHPSIHFNISWGRIPHAVQDHTGHFTRRPLVVFIQPGPRFDFSSMVASFYFSCYFHSLLIIDCNLRTIPLNS